MGRREEQSERGGALGAELKSGAPVLFWPNFWRQNSLTTKAKQDNNKNNSSSRAPIVSDKFRARKQVAACHFPSLPGAPR